MRVPAWQMTSVMCYTFVGLMGKGADETRPRNRGHSMQIKTC
jgi:hypothetical protein